MMEIDAVTILAMDQDIICAINATPADYNIISTGGLENV